MPVFEDIVLHKAQLVVFTGLVRDDRYCYEALLEGCCNPEGVRRYKQYVIFLPVAEEQMQVFHVIVALFDVLILLLADYVVKVCLYSWQFLDPLESAFALDAFVLFQELLDWLVQYAFNVVYYLV